MATINDRVLDNGLTILDLEANRVDICSQEPASYAEATSTYTLGNETSISISAPADASPNRHRHGYALRHIRHRQQPLAGDWFAVGVSGGYIWQHILVDCI